MAFLCFISVVAATAETDCTSYELIQSQHTEVTLSYNELKMYKFIAEDSADEVKLSLKGSLEVTLNIYDAQESQVSKCISASTAPIEGVDLASLQGADYQVVQFDYEGEFVFGFIGQDLTPQRFEFFVSTSKDDQSSSFADKKTLVIAVSVSVVGSVLIAAALIVYCWFRGRKITRTVSEAHPNAASFKSSLVYPSQNFMSVGSKGEVCSICCVAFTPKSLVRVLSCSHIYHNDCIDRWLITNSQCCMCRATIDLTPRLDVTPRQTVTDATVVID
jgi:hypothetical protein